MSPTANAASQRGGQRRRRQPPLREFERRFLSEKYRGGAGTLEIAMIWSKQVSSVEQYDKNSPITVGSGSGKSSPTYMIEEESFGESYELFTPTGDSKSPRWVLNISDKMDGFILVDPAVKGQGRFSFAEAAAAGVAKSNGKGGYSVQIEGGTRVKLKVGAVTFLVHYVSAAPLALVKTRSEADKLIALSLFGALGLVGICALLLIIYPDRDMTPGFDNSEENSPIADSIYKKAKEKKVEEKKKEEKKVEKKEDKPKPKPVPTVVKKTTNNKPKTSNAKPTPTIGEGPASNNPTDIKNYNTVVNTGALANASQLSMISNLGMNQKTEGAIGGLKGFDAAGGSQQYAIGASGSGVGGGGTGGGGMGGGQGVGGATSGKGSGSGDYGAEAGGGIQERGQKTPVLKPGRFQSSGNFDKKIIKRVVSRNKGKITNCYERELRKNPGIKGRIKIKWKIGSTGTVMSASVDSNEMGNNAVADCLVNTVKGWRFPAPTGGSAVEVTYPFNFDAK